MTGLKLPDLLTMKGFRAINIEAVRNRSIRTISTDTRSLKRGDAFLALRGERFNGHDFIEQAFASGAMLAIVDEGWHRTRREQFASYPLIVVPDTTHAYGTIASLYRDRFQIPVIAITGSNGKTGTREMMARVLSTKYNVLSTTGNLNNHIGLPSVLMHLHQRHEIVLAEMGTNQPGDIAYLCGIAKHTHAVITNIGRAHIERLLSREGIAQEKSVVFQTLPKHGVAIANTDEPLLRTTLPRNRKKVRFGFQKSSDVRIREIALDALARPTVTVEVSAFGGTLLRFKMRVPGKHIAYNAAAALSIGFLFDCEPAAMIHALEGYRGFDKRMQVTRTSGITIINDTYNANPDSMLVALDTLMHIKTHGRRVAVLGDMMELGKASRSEHQLLGETAASLGVEYVLTYGTNSRVCARAAGAGSLFAEHFSSRSALHGALRALLVAGDIILVKGSRSMHMEETVQCLQSTFANNRGGK